jgi:hypothetical protein
MSASVRKRKQPIVKVTLMAYLAAALRNLLVASFPKMSEYSSSIDLVLSNSS